jgi:hypothetical protein
MEYVQDKDERGKTVIRKVGLQPVQRDGLEYEFDVVGDLDQDNTLVVTKTRCSALAGAVISKPGAEFAQHLTGWLAGEPVPDAATEPTKARSTALRPPETGNGSAKGAVVKTGQWLAAAKALAERCPRYANSNGQPDFARMTHVASDAGYCEVTDANLLLVISHLEQQAATA